MKDTDIRSEFCRGGPNTILIMNRHPYATGADYTGVKLLLRAPTNDAEREKQLQGRVLRHCGFTMDEIKNAAKTPSTPIDHYVFKTTDAIHVQSVYAPFLEKLKTVRETEINLWNGSQNKSWQQMDSLLPEVTDPGALDPGRAMNPYAGDTYYGRIENFWYKDSGGGGNDEVIFELPNNERITLTENDFNALQCKLSGFEFGTFRKYDIGGKDKITEKSSCWIGVKFNNKDRRVTAFVFMQKLNDTQYYLDFACNMIAIGGPTAEKKWPFKIFREDMTDEEEMVFMWFIAKWNESQDAAFDLYNKVMNSKQLTNMGEKYNLTVEENDKSSAQKVRGRKEIK